MASFSLEQLVTQDTHIAGHTLDGIFTFNSNISIIEILPVPWLDHKAILFNIQDKQLPEKCLGPQQAAIYQDWSKIDTNTFKTILSRTKPDLEPGVNFMVTKLNIWVKDAVDLVAPKKTFSPKRNKP